MHALHQRISTQISHRHCFSVFGQHNMRIELRPHIASNTDNAHVPNCSTRTRARTHTHTHTQQYKRTACLSKANPTPTFNKRRLMRSHHRHCDVFGQRMMVRLRPQTASNTHMTPPNSSNINAHAVCPGTARHRSIDSTNEDHRRATIAIVTYLNSA